MDVVVDIALAIMLLAAAGLFIYLIITLKQVNKTIAQVRGDVNDIKNKVDPILTNVDIITNKAALLTVEVENQVNNVKHVVTDTKEKIDNLFGAAKRAKVESNGHSGPEWYHKIVGFYKGVSAFMSAFKHKN